MQSCREICDLPEHQSGSGMGCAPAKWEWAGKGASSAALIDADVFSEDITPSQHQEVFP